MLAICGEIGASEAAQHGVTSEKSADKVIAR
jgi:hypothetical protein